MKKSFLLLITLVLLIVAIINIIIYKKVPQEADIYVQDKKEHQDSLAQKQVDSLFDHGHTDIFPIYTQCKSRYVKNDFWGQTGTMFRKELWDWNHEERLPKDVISTYHVAPENEFSYYGDGINGDFFVENLKTALRLKNVDNDNESVGIIGGTAKGILQARWALGVNEKWGNGTVVQYIIIPYAVSFRRQSYGSAESFITVDEALDYAYKFYTENDQSKLKRNIVKDISNFSDGPMIYNDYYSLEKDSNASFFINTIADNSDYSHYMYNDYFYVFVRSYGKQLYHLTLNEVNLNYEKEQYISSKRDCIKTRCLIWGSTLFILWFVLFMWILCDYKQEKLSIIEKTE